MEAAPPTSPKAVRRPHTRHEVAHIAARSRWGVPRRVRLDRGLTDAERWAVYHLVESMIAGKAVAS